MRNPFQSHPEIQRMKKTNPGQPAGFKLFGRLPTPFLPGKENYFLQLIENAPQAFMVAASNGGILETNPAASRLFGYKENEFSKLTLQQLIDYNDQDFLFALVQLDKQQHITTEAIAIKKNGEKFTVELTASIFYTGKKEKRISLLLSDISERKIREAGTRLNNERYDLVVKATNDLVWDWDLASGEIFRNSLGVEKVYGHKNNESIKNIDDWLNFLHPADKPVIQEKLAYYKKSKAATYFSFEYRFRSEDGSYAYIYDRGYLLRNEAGEVIRMIGAAQNITERKKAEEAVEASEQRYKMFVQQSSEGIWRLELTRPISIDTPLEEMMAYCYNNAWIAECNDAFAKMYGFEDAQQVIGLALNAIMPDTENANMGIFRKFFNNGFKVSREITHEKDREGNDFFFENNMLGIIEDGQLCRSWGTQRNITEQKRAELALSESENRLRAIVQTDPECIKLLNRDGVVTEINNAGLKIMEADHIGQVIGKNVNEVVAPEHRAVFEALTHGVFNGLDGKLCFEIIGLKGTRRYMETHAVPLRNAAGEIISMLAVTRDISDKVKLENSLREERQIRQEQITEAILTGQEKERSQLGEELHDNINQVLATTKLYLESALADKDSKPAMVREAKLLVEKAMSEIRTLSKSLLPPSLGEVGLLQALDDLAGNIASLGKLNIRVAHNDFDEKSLSDNLKLTVFRIVQEQLNNIIKHAQAKEVLISVELKKSLVLIVKDDGIGFNTTSKRKGVGLRNISSRAEINNGKLQIDSQPGQGCELTVRFSLNKLSK